MPDEGPHLPCSSSSASFPLCRRPWHHRAGGVLLDYWQSAPSIPIGRSRPGAVDPHKSITSPLHRHRDARLLRRRTTSMTDGWFRVPAARDRGRIAPDLAAIERGLDPNPVTAAGVFPLHSHYDHAMDAGSGGPHRRPAHRIGIDCEHRARLGSPGVANPHRRRSREDPTRALHDHADRVEALPVPRSRCARARVGRPRDSRAARPTGCRVRLQAGELRTCCTSHTRAAAR